MRGSESVLAKYCFVVAILLSSIAAEQLPTTLFSARDGLSNTVPRIVADFHGFLWFPGSEGLVRFDGNGFRRFGKAQGLPGIPDDILERGDGTYWVAAEEQLCLFDPRPDRKRFECQSPRIGRIRTLVEEERGLWCGTDKGLWRRAEGGAAAWEPVQEIHPDGPGGSIAVARLPRDSLGDVWAATYSGLFRFHRDGRVQRWMRPDGREQALFVSVSETSGAIWASLQYELWRFSVDPEPPDIVLLDIGLPGMSGIQGVGMLKRRYPDLLVLMLTVYADDRRICEAMCARCVRVSVEDHSSGPPPGLPARTDRRRRTDVSGSRTAGSSSCSGSISPRNMRRARSGFICAASIPNSKCTRSRRRWRKHSGKG
jgi:CheY-like chemotaxis protein